MSTRYGECSYCGAALEPVWFTEYEYESLRIGSHTTYVRTGRKRHNVDFLECPVCGKRYVVDDSFATQWRDK